MLTIHPIETIRRAVSAAAAFRLKHPTKADRICGTLLLRQGGDTLYIEGTDRDTHCIIAVRGVTGELGRPVAADAKLLAGALTAFVDHGGSPLDAVHLECIAETGGLRLISTGGAVADIPTLAWTDFPPPLKIEGELATIPTDFALFRETLASVRRAIGVEETRYYLNGVYVHGVAASQAEPPHVAFVATDGHRMMIMRQRAAEGVLTGHGPIPPVLERGLIIPQRPISELFRLHDADPFLLGVDGVLTIANNTRFRFVSGAVTLIGRAIDGRFPDYPSVIPGPADSDDAWTCDASELDAGTRALEALASEKGPSFAVIRATTSRGWLQREAHDGAIAIPLPSSQWGPASYELEARVQLRYLRDLLASAGTARTLNFRFNRKYPKSANPIVITSPDRPGWLNVLMPMNMSDALWQPPFQEEPARAA